MIDVRKIRVTIRFTIWMAIWLFAIRPAVADVPKLQAAAPEAVGLDSAQLTLIDAAVADEIAAKRLPGCVVLIGRQGKIAYQKAFGQKQTEPESIPMTVDTVFDLASVTKPVATATSVMILADQGKLKIADTVAQHIPEFAANGKAEITIRQLLTHQSGLIADNAIADYNDGPERAFERIFALRPRFEPEARFIYSDVGFIVLGQLVERVSGKNVHEFSQEHVFRPLGMVDTGYLPNADSRARAAPTERRGEHWMQGEVHDPRAHRLGGIAGHAGLFSTAADLAVYAQSMLNRGTYSGVRIFSPETVELMTGPVAVPTGLRALGWDMRTRYSINRGETMSPAAYGHGGFTGTALWIDPELDLFVIFLSNRVHPNGKGLVNPLIGRVGTIAAKAIAPPR
jgi:CubicO group peptidase (beta-lactamase class C family)